MSPELWGRLQDDLVLLASLELEESRVPPWQAGLDAAFSAGADGVAIGVRGSDPPMEVTLPYELSDIPLALSVPRKGVSLPELPAIAQGCRDRGLLCVVRLEDDGALKGLSQPFAALFIPSEQVTNLPFLERAAAIGATLLVGSGMASSEEIGETVQTVRKQHGRLVLLHEAGRGWARPGGINLRAIPALGERFGCPVGWVMDDEQSALTLAAVALGARVVIYPGGLSAESQRRLVQETRAVRRALGSGEKSLHEIDWKPRDSQYRSIVAGVDIPRGSILRPEMLTTAPPGIGLKPRVLPSLVGRRAAVDIARGTLITLVMVE